MLHNCNYSDLVNKHITDIETDWVDVLNTAEQTTTKHFQKCYIIMNALKCRALARMMLL